jgi:hypothetical protein
MVAHHFGNRNFMQLMRRLRRGNFFLFLLGFGWGVGEVFFVPNVFPKCSLRLLFGHGSTSISCKRGGGGCAKEKNDKNMLLFWGGKHI